MENEGKIVESLSEMLHKFDVLTGEVINLKSEMVGVNHRLGKVEDEIVKLNLISADNSRSLMKLADNNDRITRLEKEVFK